jgi:hypothetical protein
MSSRRRTAAEIAAAEIARANYAIPAAAVRELEALPPAAADVILPAALAIVDHNIAAYNLKTCQYHSLYFYNL